MQKKIFEEAIKGSEGTASGEKTNLDNILRRNGWYVRIYLINLLYTVNLEMIKIKLVFFVCNLI